MKSFLLTTLVFFSFTSAYAKIIDVQTSNVGTFTCALFDDGLVKCWGQGTFGQLGIEGTTFIGKNDFDMGRNLKSINFGTTEKVIQISVGGVQACALFESKRIKCWGRNSEGELGLGDTKDRGLDSNTMGENLPFVNLGKDQKVVLMDSGRSGTCVLLESNQVKCWGYGDRGFNASGTSNNIGKTPEQMGDSLKPLDFGTDKKIVDLKTGQYHGCVLFEDGKMKCWGYNASGALGIGDSIDRGRNPNQMGMNLPDLDFGTSDKVIQIAAGFTHTCALFENNGVKCWGSRGPLGLGLSSGAGIGTTKESMGSNLPYVDFGTPEKIKQISAGGTEFSNTIGSTCVLFESGKMKCWGENSRGNLGLGDRTTRGNAPNQMGAALPFLSISSYFKVRSMSRHLSGHNCILLDKSNLIKCWGDNSSGQLGLGDQLSRGIGPGEMGDDLPFVDIGD